MKIPGPLLSVFLAAATLGAAQAPAPPGAVTLDRVHDYPFPDKLVAAPKGQRIAWTFDAQGKRNVWCADGPDFKARQLTQFNEDDGQEITHLSFTHDGRCAVFYCFVNELMTVYCCSPNGHEHIPRLHHA